MDARRTDARKLELANASSPLEPAIFTGIRSTPTRLPRAPLPHASQRLHPDDALCSLVHAVRAGASREARRLLQVLQSGWDAQARVFRDGGAAPKKDEALLEEHRGLAVWSLGIAAEEASDPGIRRSARALYLQVLPAVVDAQSPRAMAKAMVGAAAFLRTYPGHEASGSLLEHGGTMFNHLLAPERRPAWSWFEAVLGSEYALLPDALMEAGETLARPDWRTTARQVVAWIARQERAGAPVAA